MQNGWTIAINVCYQCGGLETPQQVYVKINNALEACVFNNEEQAHTEIADIIRELETDSDSQVSRVRFTTSLLPPDYVKEIPHNIELDRRSGEITEYRVLDSHELHLFAKGVYDALGADKTGKKE